MKRKNQSQQLQTNDGDGDIVGGSTTKSTTAFSVGASGEGGVVRRRPASPSLIILVGEGEKVEVEEGVWAVVADDGDWDWVCVWVCGVCVPSESGSAPIIEKMMANRRRSGRRRRGQRNDAGRRHRTLRSAGCGGCGDDGATNSRSRRQRLFADNIATIGDAFRLIWISL